MKVLLSIKPEFVEKIIKGEKKFEYRRRIFKREVECIVIYASSPRKAIVGEFLIEEIIEKEIKLLWQETHKYSGIDKDIFWKYFDGVKLGYAIKIGKLKVYKNPIKIEKFGKKPPQSFLYL